MPRQVFSRRRFLQQAAGSVAATTAGLSLTSCGWRLANVRPVSRQGDPTKLYIFSWAGYTDERLLSLFEKKTGIKAIVDVYDGNEAMLAKYRSGGGAQYSVIYPSDYMVRQMRELNLLQTLDHGRLRGVDHLFPNYQNPLYDRQNEHSIPVAWGTTGLVYNTKKLDMVPEDWEFLWAHQDKVRRRLTLVNDPRETIGASLKRLGFSYNTKKTEEVERAYQALRQLRPAVTSFTTDGWRDRIVAGDLTVAMGYSSDAADVEKENTDLRYAIPKSGSSLWTDTMVIPVTAPNVDGAYAWFNFMLDPEVAAFVTKNLAFATPNRAAYETLPTAIRENPSLFPSEQVLAKCESLAPLGEFTAVFERYWTELLSG